MEIYSYNRIVLTLESPQTLGDTPVEGSGAAQNIFIITNTPLCNPLAYICSFVFISYDDFVPSA